MRQSLSVSRSQPHHDSRRVPGAGLALAVAGAVVLAVAGLIDQLGARTLMEHATTMYAPRGKDVSAGLLYGLIYAIAAASAVLWLLVARSGRAGSRRTAPYAAAVVLIGAGMALALLGSQEYGEQIFPPVWGLLALLSPVAGGVVLVQLARRRTA